MDRERFRALWNRCRIDGEDGADDVYDRLEALYSEPGRHYHTKVHIEHCLRQFDIARPHMEDPDAVELALWFHDAIYDSAARDNEQRSAELFTDLVGDAVPAALRDKVWDLIMVTTHRQEPRTLDECFMCDIDLSSFGRPWEEFARDSEAVRSECGHVPDADFYPRQQVFLASLLERDSFCYTEFFRRRHEGQARRNIRRHLDGLARRNLS